MTMNCVEFGGQTNRFCTIFKICKHIYSIPRLHAVRDSASSKLPAGLEIREKKNFGKIREISLCSVSAVSF